MGGERPTAHAEPKRLGHIQVGNIVEGFIGRRSHASTCHTRLRGASMLCPDFGAIIGRYRARQRVTHHGQAGKNRYFSFNYPALGDFAESALFLR